MAPWRGRLGALAAGVASCALAGAEDGSGFCPDDAPQRSGYLPVAPGLSYFYYLAASRSPQPRADPLLLWLTGGPGCSSMLALLIENGPCSVRGRRGDGSWELARNPWSWTEAANVLWVDQPVGVGFSSNGELGQLVYDERGVGQRMGNFLRQFFAKFPEYSAAPFFIFGESYGGHYVPAVAAQFLRDASPGLPVLQGIAIGNGQVSPATQWGSMPTMAFTGGAGGSLHGGVVNESTYLVMRERVPDCERGVRDCALERDVMQCYASMARCVASQILPVKATGRNPYDLRKPCLTTLNASDPASGICYHIDDERAFLNSASTKRSLGVPQERFWEPCNMTSLLPFILSGDEMTSLDGTVAMLLEAGVRVLVYAGDTDFMADWLGCRAWVEALFWEHHDEWVAAPREPFVAGSRTRGVVQSARGLTFLQIFEAGHMVPMDQPEVALAMVREFLSAPPRLAPRLAETPGRPRPGALLGAAAALGAVLAALTAVAVARARSSAEAEAYVRLA